MNRVPLYLALVMGFVLPVPAGAQFRTPEGAAFFRDVTAELPGTSAHGAASPLAASAGWDGATADPAPVAGALPDDDGPAAWPPSASPPSLSFDAAAVHVLPFELTTIFEAELLEFLEYYATEGRRRVVAWLARAGRYQTLLGDELARVGAPREVLWVAAVESDFSFTVRSRAGAMGMFQFMPQTARARGMRVDREVDERRDPVLAAGASGTYLVDLHRELGSWPLALAAYNAGLGHVRGGMRAAAATDFWDFAAYATVYESSRRYALRVIALAIIDANRAAFGLDSVVPDEPWRFDIVEVAPNTQLATIGRATQASAADIAALNPALLAARTPRGTHAWQLRVPEGTGSRVADAAERGAVAPGGFETVPLRFGETLDDVAAARGLTARALRAMNGLDSDATVAYGDELLVPAPSRIVARDPAPPPRVVVPATRFAFADRARVIYRPTSRDTVWSIARHFHVDPYHLAAWNDLDLDAPLLVGSYVQVFVDPAVDLSDTIVLREADVEIVPVGSEAWLAPRETTEAPRAPAARPAAARTYRVRSGDTIGAIADRFNVSVRDLRRLNGLGEDLRIVAGQQLVLRR